MQAVVVTPGQQDSARAVDVDDPSPTDGPMLVQTLAIGICGTDKEINSGAYGSAPDGADHLIIGHESLGRVVEDPSGTHSKGDLVVSIVRRPCTIPCANCAVGEWDFCKSGEYTERGIYKRHGYASEHYRVEPEFAVGLPASMDTVGVLLEPTTVVAKAWEHIERIGARSVFQPKTVLVTGAGPIGLLAAMIGVQKGLDVHVLDIATDGPKPQLVADLGATYHTENLPDLTLQPDIAIECTGVPSVVFDAMDHTGRNGILCLTGVSSRGRSLSLDGGGVNRDLVLENDIVFGSVNANKRHYEQGVSALEHADQAWLARLISRRVAPADVTSAMTAEDGDIKVVLDFSKT